MFMSNWRMMKEANEIVQLHGPLILKELGLDNSDGILDRIFVTEDIGYDTPHGYCEIEIIQTRKLFSIFPESTTCRPESAKITVNPLTFFYIKKKDGRNVPILPIFRFFKKPFRRLILFTLAHELRHYWQYTTGEYFEKELTTITGASLMPYHMRWCERDANEFALQYIKGGKR